MKKISEYNYNALKTISDVILNLNDGNIDIVYGGSENDNKYKLIIKLVNLYDGDTTNIEKKGDGFNKNRFIYTIHTGIPFVALFENHTPTDKRLEDFEKNLILRRFHLKYTDDGNVIICSNYNQMSEEDNDIVRAIIDNYGYEVTDVDANEGYTHNYLFETNMPFEIFLNK